MFSFENGPDIDRLASVSEFLGDTLNVWDIDRALLYCI
jgi:hypothetical protein